MHGSIHKVHMKGICWGHFMYSISHSLDFFFKHIKTLCKATCWTEWRTLNSLWKKKADTLELRLPSLKAQSFFSPLLLISPSPFHSVNNFTFSAAWLFNPVFSIDMLFLLFPCSHFDLLVEWVFSAVSCGFCISEAPAELQLTLQIETSQNLFILG
jgi:hypothetical protein